MVEGRSRRAATGGGTGTGDGRERFHKGSDERELVVEEG